MVQYGRMHMRMTTITLRVQNLTLSSQKWSPYKQLFEASLSESWIHEVQEAVLYYVYICMFVGWSF